MAAAMPFAGSAYSWVNVLFGEFFWMGCRLGLLLAEYFIAVAFVASGFSANLRGLVKPIGIELPAALSNPFGTNGGFIDIIAAIVILLTALLLSRGMSEAAYGKYFSYFKSISYYFICHRRFNSNKC